MTTLHTYEYNKRIQGLWWQILDHKKADNQKIQKEYKPVKVNKIGMSW